jgi:hypothetical protein
MFRPLDPDRVLILASVLALCLLCAPANATILTTGAITWGGNTQPACACSGVDGTVDFAVYNKTGGTSMDPFGVGGAIKSSFVSGTGSGPLDASATYLYLFETVDNGSNTLPISSNSVGLASSSLATSWGYFGGWAFTVQVVGTPAGFANNSPASTGATPSVSTQTGLYTPSSLSVGPSSVIATYATNIAAGGNSVLWGFTSNNPPVLTTTSIQDGGTSGFGNAPTPGAVPEASTTLLSFGAGLLIALSAIWRRRLARNC